MGRKKFYETVDEMQKDLDAWLVHYNTERPHQGRGMKGRTPAQGLHRRAPQTHRHEGGKNE